MRNVTRFSYNGFEVAQADGRRMNPAALWVASDGSDTYTGDLAAVLSTIDMMVAESEAIERMRQDFQIADAIDRYLDAVEEQQQELLTIAIAARECEIEMQAEIDAQNAARRARIARFVGYVRSVALMGIAIAMGVAIFVALMQ